jgi:large-conductance mechanosensitive channel
MNYNYYTEIPSKQLNQPSTISNTNNNINTDTNKHYKTNNENKTDTSYIHKIKTFLTSPNGTIIAVAFGVAIGNAFKEFVNSAVENILQPLIIFIISKTYINNYYDIASFISPQKNVVNFELFISNFITFLLVVITVYIIHNKFFSRL